MSRKDVIIAAETGSGKTHGYLAPIIDQLTNTPFDSDSDHMNGEQRPPNIIVSTPAALLNNIEPKRNRRVEFLRFVKYVVFDVDMLLCGSFQNQIIRLINMLRFDEKQVSRWATSFNLLIK